jgi:cardiolipin synthase
MARRSPVRKFLKGAWSACCTAFGKCWKRYTGWEMALLGIGWACFVSLVVILLLPIGKGPQLSAPATAMPAPASPAFLKNLSYHMALPIDQAPPVETLKDGNAFVRALMRDIDGARHSINFMVYIWEDGNFNDMVLAHLERKQRQGVQVRVMLDAYGAAHAPGRKLERLKEAGGRIATFRSLNPLPWNFLRNTKRNHRRSIVIDGTTGYTGGIAVADSWLGQARTPDEWHDFMFRMTGSMAGRLQGSFAELWAQTTGEVLLGEAFYPATLATGTIPYVTVSTSPSPDLYEADVFLFFSLLSARHSIHLETPYFLPDATIRGLLKQKARTGVDVALVLPNQHTDQNSVRWAGQRIFTELLEAGVKIYEYQPTFTHAKLLLVDEAWSVIGTANWDNRSRKINDEILFGIADPDLTHFLEQEFAEDVGKSKQIRLEEWRKRGPVQRALEIVSQALVQQY